MNNSTEVQMRVSEQEFNSANVHSAELLRDIVVKNNPHLSHQQLQPGQNISLVCRESGRMLRTMVIEDVGDPAGSSHIHIQNVGAFDKDQIAEQERASARRTEWGTRRFLRPGEKVVNGEFEFTRLDGVSSL